MKNESFNLHNLLGILLAIAIPISMLVTNILIITLLAYSIYIAISTKKFKIEYSHYLFLPVLFFIIELISIFYSNNLQEGFFQLEKKLSFFIFPFIFSINTYQVKPFNISSILWFFSISILIVCIVSHCLALYSIFIHNLPLKKFIDYEYSGHELLKYFKLHATYAGAYILLSISFLTFKFKNSSNKVRIFLALANTYLIFCALHTSSRIIFIILLILIAITLFEYIKITNILLRFAIVLLSVVFILVHCFIHCLTCIGSFYGF